MSRLAWLFPGQGSQYPGMGKELCAQYPAAREVFEEADDVLGYALSELCFEGTSEQLRQTAVTQPAILTMSIAVLRVYLKELGEQPSYAAGHSLGEYSALVSAGVLAFADALRIVETRGTLMQQAATSGIGAMCAVIGSNPEQIEGVCKDVSTSTCSVTISNYNASDQTVISGHREAVEQAADRLKQLGARTASLPVSAPFHSPLMASAAAQLQPVLEACTMHDPLWGVLSNVHGQPYGSKEEVVRLLTAQMTAPVRWDLSMQYLVEQGVSAAIEIGPRTVLTNLMKANAAQIVCLPLERDAQLSPVRNAVQRIAHDSAADQAAVGVEPSTEGGNTEGQLIVRCLAAAVSTRNRNWDEQQYRQGVVEPYRQLEAIQERLDKSGDTPSLDEMKQAIELLARMMRTKQVPHSEQQERFAEIMRTAGEHADALRELVQEAVKSGAGGDRHGTVIDQG